MSFVDNHDVTRVSTILNKAQHLPLLYGLLFGMPGIPCIYYGSEWGTFGDKQDDNDDALRPNFSNPQWNNLTDLISKLAYLHKQYKSLLYGDYKNIIVTNKQLVFEREFEGERIWISINADSEEYYIRFDMINTLSGANELLSKNHIFLRNGYMLPPFSLFYWKLD